MIYSEQKSRVWSIFKREHPIKMPELRDCAIITWEGGGGAGK